MFYAIDEQGNRIHILSAYNEKQYFCPICKEHVIIKASNSKIVAKHFSHEKNTTCDAFSHDMSEWHLRWQSRFPFKNQEVLLPFDKPCHRADVLACGYVIEFQHSPISDYEFQLRNDFYTSLGKKVVWVFDVNEKYQKKHFLHTEPTYIYDGEDMDKHGRIKKKWIKREFRTGNTFRANCGFDGCNLDEFIIDYEYSNNENTTDFMCTEWKWKWPLNTLVNYHPQINTNVIVFLEMLPGKLEKIIWCDDIFDIYGANQVGEDLHGCGSQFDTPSNSLYLKYRKRFVQKSDFRSFTSAQYSITNFLDSIKNRLL